MRASVERFPSASLLRRRRRLESQTRLNLHTFRPRRAVDVTPTVILRIRRPRRTPRHRRRRRLCPRFLLLRPRPRSRHKISTLKSVHRRFILNSPKTVVSRHPHATMIAVAVVRRLRRRRRSRIVITPILFPTAAHIPLSSARVHERTPPRTLTGGFLARISRIARLRGVVRSIGIFVSTRSSSRDNAVAVARFWTRFDECGCGAFVSRVSARFARARARRRRRGRRARRRLTPGRQCRNNLNFGAKCGLNTRTRLGAPRALATKGEWGTRDEWMT